MYCGEKILGGLAEVTEIETEGCSQENEELLVSLIFRDIINKYACMCAYIHVVKHGTTAST